MKKIYIITCLFLLTHLLGVAKTISKEGTESNVKKFMKNVTQLISDNHKTLPQPAFKSIVAKSMMLEKVTLADGSSKELKYNEQGQAIDYKYFEFDESTNAILLTEHNTFSYDEKGNIILQVFNTLQSDELIITEKEEFEYDSQNREILYIYYSFDYTYGKLIGNSKSITSYQANGSAAEDYSWDEEAQTWNLETKTEIEIKNGLPIKGTYYYKNEETGVVEKSMIMEITYDDKDRPTIMLAKAIDDSTGLMVDFMKSVTTYNSNGYEILDVTSMFDADSVIWMDFSKTETSYNSKGQITSEDSYAMDWMTSELVIDEKHEYSYTNDQLSQELYWIIDYVTNQLSQSQKLEFTYDNTINVENLILPDTRIENSYYSDLWGEFQYSFGALSNVKRYEWNYVSEALVLSRDATYHYSEIGSALSVNSLNVANMKIGPNPFTENLTISLSENEPAQISVYNFSGQMVHNTLINNSKTIITSDWKPGIYMVHTNSGKDHNQVIKLVKR